MNYQGKILSHRVWFKAAAGKNEKTAQSSHRKAGALRERLPEEVAVQSPSDVASLGACRHRRCVYGEWQSPFPSVATSLLLNSVGLRRARLFWGSGRRGYRGVDRMSVRYRLGERWSAEEVQVCRRSASPYSGDSRRRCGVERSGIVMRAGANSMQCDLRGNVGIAAASTSLPFRRDSVLSGSGIWRYGRAAPSEYRYKEPLRQAGGLPSVPPVTTHVRFFFPLSGD